MTELAATAERLRQVRAASRHFLTLWALDLLWHKPDPLDRFARDIERAVADPHNRDWSMLYRGSILDD